MQNDRYRLTGTYDRLRGALLEHPDSGRLDKDLAYWVLPSDKRLPIAFLDRKLGDLLATPLDELLTTPGIGQKKILAFFDLLRRAAKATPAEAPFGLPTRTTTTSTDLAGGPFDPARVSDAMWATWCESVRRYGFEHETLGRITPSLQRLPSVMWRTRLEHYSALSLPQMRALKTHGSKRIAAIMEVFFTVHEAVSVAALPDTIDLQLAPRFVAPVTRWLLAVAEQPGSPPPLAEVQRSLVRPLLDQIENDLGPNTARLATERLTPSDAGVPPTVKEIANGMGVTRARVYQLLDECAQAMAVRWPEGEWITKAVLARIDPADHKGVALMHHCRDLFYPDDIVGVGRGESARRQATTGV